MWEYNTLEDRWKRKRDFLDIDNYNFLKEEQESVRYYANCFSGATYIPINDENNIYDILSKRRYKTWYIDPNISDYVSTLVPPNYPVPINRDSFYDYYTRNLSEYSLTLKNLFTPEKIIKDSFNSFIYVDLATTEEILDLSENVENRVIDGVKTIDGHRILVKDQVKTTILPITTDPDEFFDGNYRLIETIGLNSTYEYYDETNGVYLVDQGNLIKQNDLDDYNVCVRYSISVKLGEVNKNKEFHLSRLLNGFYPTTRFNEPIEFVEKENRIIRNQIDYNNVLDLNYFDILKHPVQSYDFENVNYTIPERIITVGEFGSIINNQSGKSNILRNKYKVNLRSIDQTNLYYWAVGDGGTLLRIRKHDFDIDRVNLEYENETVTDDLKSISFFNDLNGVIVGKANTIFVTKDGGRSWNKILVSAFGDFEYNKVIFYSVNKFFVGGNNGVFIEFRRESTNWVAYKRRISRFLDSEDEFLLIDNINDMLYTTIDTWNPEFLFSEKTTKNPKELIFMVTNDSNIIVYDIENAIPFDNDFIYLEFENSNYGDITSIERKGDTGMFYFIGFQDSTENSGIFSFNIDDFEFIGVENEASNRSLTAVLPTLISTLYPNKLFDYNGNELLIGGNNSLLKASNYNDNFEDLDTEFLEKLKSKMLFLDYDIGSKLNFFTDSGDYRLPEEVSFDSSDILNSSITIEPLESELHWFDYWKDSNSTFEYFSADPMTDNSKVVYSNSFRNSNENVLSTSGDNVEIELDNLLKLAPSFSDDKNSRFVKKTDLEIDTSEIDTSKVIFLYDYLMVLRYDNSIDTNSVPQVGDVLEVDTDFLTGNFLVNKKITTSEGTFVYLYTDFSDSIIRRFEDSSQINITNLNTYKNIDDLVGKFNKHPISYGYSMESNNEELTIEPKFNNVTSYYNLACNVIHGNNSSEMLYEESFIKFGYTPTYNILDYLQSISGADSGSVNPIFFENKEYYSMPVYNGIPINQNDGKSIYVDYNILNNNKLIFGKELEFEWTSIFINSFIDIVLYEGEDFAETEQLLVIDKYYDERNETYVIEFHDKMNYPNGNQVNPLTMVDIISRRTLKQISEDLALLNNIQRSYSDKKYRSGTFDSGQLWNVSFKTLDKKLNFKINTDSYAKILLSDFKTNNAISGVIYTDFKNELALNITRLEEKIEVPIINTSNVNGKLYVQCSEKHELSNGDGVLLSFDGGQGSSEVFNPQYFGYRVVTIANEFDFFTDINYGIRPTIGRDTGLVRYTKKDSFLNYQPTDLIDIGVDKLGSISILLKPENTRLVGSLYSLNNVDFENYRFRLIDGLNVETLAINYSWIYESEISNAVIGLDNNGLVWYKGNWDCGRWFGGTWISGRWISGDWYDGIWKSKNIKDNFINIDIDNSSDNLSSSTWVNGRWFGGTWENGTWRSGRWYGGTWENGEWLDGIWNEGEWLSGEFKSGIWSDGTWENGKFNTSNGPAYWLDGNWNGGDFENGMWYNGIFDSKGDKESRFGIKSYNSRASIWKSGKFINGSFHSRLNIDNNGNYDVSEIHKYSIWETGTWFSGDFYGGVVYNMDFRSGIWHGGIVEDVDIVGINTDEDYITISKEYRYNVGDQITIIGEKINQVSAFQRSIINVDVDDLGSNDDPKTYTVVNSVIENGNTNIFIDVNLTDEVNNQNIDFKSVTRFRNGEWRSGLWFNGLFENGNWKGGLWYNGVFNSEWM
jgi:hypothetical protein